MSIDDTIEYCVISNNIVVSTSKFPSSQQTTSYGIVIVQDKCINTKKTPIDITFAQRPNFTYSTY